VVKKQLPLKIHAHRADDILTAIRIAKEYGLRVTLDHCTEGHLIVEEIKRSGFDAIVGPSFGFKTKPELRNKTFETAAILAHNGIKVAIMTDHPVHNQCDLPLFAGMAVKAGMTRQEALEAITINPAEILGIEDRVGSLVSGKDADIVIWDNDPLSVESRVFCTMVDGRVVYQA
jgi:imidazolonepropionase-like amidohydrolase